MKGGSDIRLAGSAILQADGTVRIEGGVNASGKVLAAATYFDPRVSKMGMKPQLAAEYAAQAIATFPADRSLAASLHGPLVLRFAKPVNVRELNTDAVTLIGPTGPVTAKVMATNEGRLAFVQVPDDLYPGSRYTLFVKGLHAADGTPLSDTIAGFATQASPATSVMLAGDGNRRTVPDQRASSGQPPLVVMTGDGKGCPGATDELCREHSFIRDGAWYPGNDNIPDATGGHWRLYLARSTLPDTSAMESALPAGTTALIGQIRQIDEKPVANVEVSIGARKVRTDINGVFVLKDVPAGRQEVFVDGRSAGKDQKQYGRFVVGADVGAKAINHMPFVMYLPRVLPRDEVTLPAPTTQEVVVTHPDMPGLEVHIPPGTVLRDREGKVLTKIAIVPTPVDRAPFPLPDNFPMYFTVQPSDAVIQGLTAQAGQGIRVVYPNYGKAAPRTQGNFWVYDVQAGWKMYGGGHVTDDAKHLAPDPGVSLVWTVGAGASLGNSEPPTANRPGGACAADPIDLQTGIFYHEWADLVINDVVPLVLKRSFNSADTVSHAFGVGSSSNFGMHLYSSDGSYTQPQLVLDCGQGIAFDLTAGTATYPFSGTVWTHTKSATGYYGAKLQFLGYWLVTLRSGFQYAFEAHAPNRLQWTKDRFGNQTQYSYNAGLINQITSPSGRTLAFSYDTSNRIATATDNTGRVVKYTYNATMFDGTSTGTTALGTVTYPDNTTEKYTYRNCSGFSCTLRTTMQDRKGNTYLTNDYYSQNCPAFGPCNGISWRRVSRQTLADGTSYGFSYTTSGNNVTATQVTKPNGNSDYYTFDSVSGYPLAVTRGYGTSLAQTTSYSRAASGLVSSQTDPLGRVTTYAYDTLGNVASITALAGTANAAIVTYTYTSDYNQIASITDPLGHVTQFGYTAGCLTSVTNALNNITRFVCNGSGQPTAVTDPLGHTTTLAYSGKDLSAVNSPLNQLITYTTDALGRLTAVQDPLGRTSTIQPDSNDRITGAQDPKNLSYSYGYDNNGNFTNISGAVSTQNFSYDNRDRTTQRRDALNQSESWTYDGSSNLSTYTDRKSQKTTYSYDALDRVSKVTYADGNTTSLYYDNGNRLTQAVDSVSGTITRSYDQFDRLSQEQTPQGTVSYTYDAAGRRSTMTAASQAQVSYSYDAANRLTQVSQGSETVSIGYDAANRRTSVTLPNGVVTNYTYDNANQLTNIVYRTSGNAVLSSIAYAYDAAGQRIRKTGGFASDPLTGTTASNSQFDANNRLTQGSGYSFSYDANGDMTQVSIPVTYIFDARHRLSAVSQNGSVVHSFSYDVFGRRTSKTIFGTTTTFLYDGANPVQETQGGAISSILNGLGIDERYARSEAAGRRYFLTDALGSTVALTDASANVVQTYAYEPYGKVAASGSSANPYQYAGRENDGNGLYYYRARYYSHGWQRFFSEDPIGLVGGLNAYAYVNGNPMSYSDPSGRVWQYAGAAVVGGLFGGVVNGLNYFSLGCSFWKGFENGFAGGAVTGIATVAGQPILGGAAGGAVTTYLNRQDGVMVSPNPYVDIGIGATAGGIGSWVGGNVGSILTSDWGIYAAGSQELGDFIGNVAGASAGTGINNAFNTSSTMNGDSPPCRCQ
ncbi:MAG: RHS repeat protein [Rudaea sp.]|nr:RHS repeat protein [Rudaea sp.]